MYSFIVCDDNKIICDSVNDIIKKVSSKCDINYSITLFSDYNDDFINYIKNNKKTNIYILDIETPSRSGIDIASLIRKNDHQSIIIFLTSHNELAFDIIRKRLNVFTFISKLVDYKKDLSRAIIDAIKYITPDHFIHFNDYKNTYSINTNNILYITKIGRKTSIVTDNNTYDVYISLTKIEELLPSYFVKSHRACIINTNRVEEIKYSKKSITFDNGIIIDLISDKYKKELCKTI